MPRFWTRLVDSLPRESKSLTWRVPLVLVVIVLAVFIFYPFRDAPYAVMEVKDVYRRGEPIPEKREVLSHEVTDRMVWLTSPFHYRIERELSSEDLPPEGGFPVKKRTLQIRSKGLNLGLDLSGGSELLYRIQMDEETQKSTTATQMKSVIRRRIDASGLREPRIQVQGNNRILVQLPGQEASQLEYIKRVIEDMGHLEFRLVASEDSPAWRKYAETGRTEAPEGFHAYDLRSLKAGEEEATTETVLISDEVQVTGEYISSTYVNTSGTGASLRPTVNLNFDSRGQQLFGRVTSENTGKRLAIILNTRRDAEGNITVPGKCYSAPVIKTAIFGTAEISGDFDLDEARALQTVLMAGSLPAPLKLEHENTVGASLGPALIVKGLRAIGIGLCAVLAFMVAYYWLAGLIADFALFLNILLIVAIMVLFDATLTLPGIAGLLLTVGMSVDANVLIFERVREEAGGPTDKPLRLAIRDGYDRAFWTIFDANLTTLFTAIILYWRGTGAVKGFATVLIVGILCSMFTALVCTRVVFEFLCWRRWIRRLPMLQLIKNPQLTFMRLRNKFLIGSLVVIAGGLTVFGTRGDDNWDIDFKGGQLIHLVFQQEMDADQLADRLREAGPHFADVELQPISSAAQEGSMLQVGRQATEFVVRFPYLSEVNVGSITVTPKQTPGTLKTLVNLHIPARPEDVQAALDAAKLTRYTIAPEGEPDDDGKLTTFTLTALETDPQIARTELDRALVEAKLKPVEEDTAIANFDVQSIEPNYQSEAENVTIDRPVALAEIQRELEVRAAGQYFDIQPNSDDEGGGRYRAFTIKSTLDSDRQLRDLIEAAFASQTLTAEVSRLFEEDLAPQGVQTLETTDGTATVAVNLTSPIATDTLTTKLASWQMEDAEVTPENATDGQAARFLVSLPKDKVADLTARLTTATETFPLSDPIPRVAKVGPTVAREMLLWAVVAIAAASVIIVAYVWLRFERFKYGTAAVAALIHDVLITIGLLAVVGMKFNLPIVAAILTIIGYSINDTIVVFDRIRENLRKARKRDVDAELIDTSINQVLSRTVLTSVTTLLAVLSLFIFAGGVIQDFALTLLIGVVVGTYSSIFIASPLLILHQTAIEKRSR
jgi:protein-export membrane protein SecD/preprotein translocase SecF subunit